MKILTVLVILSLLTGNAFAQFSVDEEAYLKYTYALEQLKEDRNKLISDRDALLLAEDIKNNSAKQLIINNAEINIDAKEQEISDMEGQLDTLVNK